LNKPIENKNKNPAYLLWVNTEEDRRDMEDEATV
jgi:hypothetical protein